MSDRHGLRAVKQDLLRSNTRNVYKHDTDDEWAARYPEVQRIADEIEARRIELGRPRDSSANTPASPGCILGGMAAAFRGPARCASSWRHARLRGRRSGFLLAGHDPDRTATRRDRRIARLRSHRHRPFPDTDGNRDQGPATRRGRATPLAGSLSGRDRRMTTTQAPTEPLCRHPREGVLRPPQAGREEHRVRARGV